MRPSAANSVMNHLSDDVYVNDDKENPDDRDELIENQCHICELQLPNKVDLFDHVETDHKKYFIVK